MAPRRAHAAVSTLSTVVHSHDLRSILVEAGGFTPLRWFLDDCAIRSAVTHDRPRKRQKTGNEKAQVSSHLSDFDTSESPLLFEVTVDFIFDRTVDSESSEAVPYYNDISVKLLNAVNRDGCSTIMLASTKNKSPVLEIECTEIASSVMELLSTPMLCRHSPVQHGRRSGSEYPASVLTCTMTQSLNADALTVQLKASLHWRPGISAFPHGAPHGSSRVYPDYEILATAFPDSSRPAIQQKQPFTPHEFYDCVHSTKMQQGESNIPDRVLDSSLYPFQQRAVEWLLRREGVEYREQRLVDLPAVVRRNQNIQLEVPVVDLDGKGCFVNHLRGTISSSSQDDGACQVSGGLLAEEMGLGKTVELMALISLHRRPPLNHGAAVLDDSGNDVTPSKATLIITPISILQQWRSELERHAPSLRVLHYEGVPSGHDPTKKTSTLLQDLASNYDVVLATYHTLAKEVHFTEDPPKRDMRNAPRFERKRSPLVQINWWRICLDEAQMVESGVTNAARVACRLPRVHSWAVSGTPLRKDVQDLCGLLIFLKYRPFSDNPHLWGHLLNNHRHLFRQIFGKIALRHTKAMIRDELVLPPQKRVVITVPFSVIEQQNYTQMFDAMCREVELQPDGSPLSGDWDPEDTRVIESMRSWLTRLRQTCLHPQVGVKNRRALGRGSAPLRTVSEVLEVMIEQNEAKMRQEERLVVSHSLDIAKILGNNEKDPLRSEKALAIFRDAMTTCDKMVEECRARLRTARVAITKNGQRLEDSDSDGEESSGNLGLMGNLKTNLRHALQLQHTCIFFVATAYYQIKTNQQLTEPESAQFQELETEETKLYDRAKIVRKEILRHCAKRAEGLMGQIETSEWIIMPHPEHLEDFGGIESRRIVEKSDELFRVLREQTGVIVEWRSKMAKYLIQPLVDRDEGDEITGEEYEESTKQQDELYAYFDAFKAMQADLNTLVTGEKAPLIDHEVKFAIKQCKAYFDPEIPESRKPQVHAPKLALDLLTRRNELRSRIEKVISVRGLLQEARSLESSLLGNESSSRTVAERTIIKRQLTTLQRILATYNKVILGLEKELSLFRVTQNQRVEFYRQLQEISDDVAPYKDELDKCLDERALAVAEHKESQSSKLLAQLRTKHRFLVHLREESGEQAEPKHCVICQSSFERGVLTVCGHQYCKDCITHWFAQSKTCPICKRRLGNVDIHDIVLKPQELRAQEEKPISEPLRNTHASCASASIYSDVEKRMMDDIKAIDLPISYGTKIDTLGRHLHYLRERDPGAKSIIFSQYREFLDVLSTALTHFKIGYARFGKPTAAERFKHDPAVDCLLLDAKTDSSGLTLVAATHVFICEPLVQTAVELQAIARVHRIGQTRPTTVWMYLVSDTVEEAIYDLSVARRLAHVRSRATNKSLPSAPTSAHEVRDERENADGSGPPLLQETAIDAANSEELESAPLTKLLVAGKSGGERVDNDDLWQCLFGKARSLSGSGTTSSALRGEVERHLRAEAAEARQGEVDSMA